MKSNFNQSRDGIRSEMRSKRRKTNMILNGLIVLVLLLIIIVSVSIFSKDDEAKKQQDSQAIETKTTNDVAGKQANQTQNSTSQDKKTKTTTKNNTKNNEVADDNNDKEDNTAIETEGGGDNVQKTIINPKWEAVGTSQTGPNSSQSVDWDERVKALAYAIGADQSNMTVWYLSFDGGSDKSIGTVTEKGKPEAYRVYLEWQNGDGWKPVKVEELIENDKVQQ
ncbi:YrrS family protein [Bacillus sp. DNRA2]|uniref:YrrS family protein n=1 Tax=Bacillus sp. DNRA2 TaxID=2723053 RepID=UPI002006E470|nr:YrrS family protein [Bacillus sp. DNRA2]